MKELWGGGGAGVAPAGDCRPGASREEVLQRLTERLTLIFEAEAAAAAAAGE